MKRVFLIVSGDVQGVGFRAWTKRLAKALSLTGWVQNRDNGTVAIVAEGSAEVLKMFVDQVRQGPDVAWVEHLDIQWGEGNGEFLRFEVLY